VLNHFLEGARLGYVVAPVNPTNGKTIVGAMRFGDDADTRRTFDSWFRSYRAAACEISLGDSGIVAVQGTREDLAAFAKTHGIKDPVLVVREVRNHRGVVRNETFAILRRRNDARQLVPVEIDGISLQTHGTAPIPNVAIADVPEMPAKLLRILIEAPAKIEAARLADVMATRVLQSGRAPIPEPPQGSMIATRSWEGMLGSRAFRFERGSVCSDPQVIEMARELQLFAPIGSPFSDHMQLKPGQIRLLARIVGTYAGQFWDKRAGDIISDNGGEVARILDAHRLPYERAA
jgi:hypothetical protein